MFLAIDASQPHLWVALGEPDDALEQHATNELSHSEELSHIVTVLLNARGVKATDLTALILGSGPGSFTGLRIGYSFAKGLCLAANLSLVEVPSFDAMAAAYVAQYSQVNVVSDARRDEVFLASYRHAQVSAAAQIVSRSELIKYDGIFVCPSKGERERLGLSDAVLPLSPASALIKIGAGSKHLKALSGAHDLAKITPFYLRMVAAKSIAERT